MIRAISALAVASVLAPLHAAAQNQNLAPASCTPFLVVQMENCIAVQHLQCEEDNTIWSVVYIEPGPVVVSRYNQEFQWLDTINFFTQEREELAASVDPASLSELLETGEDTYTEVIDVDGPEGRRTKTVVGFDRLTGESVKIDGEELLQTEFAYQVTYSDDTPGYSVSGEQFVLADDRLFLAGIETREEEGDRSEADYSPRAFARPGDDDFNDLTPRFGCNMAEISLSR